MEDEDNEINESVNYEAMDGVDIEDQMSDNVIYGLSKKEHHFQRANPGVSDMKDKVSTSRGVKRNYSRLVKMTNTPAGKANIDVQNGRFNEQGAGNLGDAIHQNHIDRQADFRGCKELFVGQLDVGVTSGMLYEEFTKVGPLFKAGVFRDRQSGSSMGCGYVCFINASDAASAVKSKNGTLMHGRQIDVFFQSSTPYPTESAVQRNIGQVMRGEKNNNIRRNTNINPNERYTFAPEAQGQLQSSTTGMFNDGIGGRGGMLSAAEGQEQNRSEKAREQVECEEFLSHLSVEDYNWYKREAEILERLEAQKVTLRKGLDELVDLDDRIKWFSDHAFDRVW